MSLTLLQMQPSTLQLHDQLEYPQSGILSKLLLQDHHCFVVMPAHAPHALQAIENLAFLLILSAPRRAV